MLIIESQGMQLRIPVIKALTMSVNDEYADLDEMLNSLNENLQTKASLSIVITDMRDELDRRFKVKSSKEQ